MKKENPKMKEEKTAKDIKASNALTEEAKRAGVDPESGRALISAATEKEDPQSDEALV